MGSIYVETSIFGYLTACSGRDVIFQARQHLTRRWWHERRHRFDVFVSQLVFEEASAGDPKAAAERVKLLEGLRFIGRMTEVDQVAELLVTRHLLPAKALADAQHIAYAAIAGVDYVLTWNCRHLANAERLPGIYATLRSEGLSPPLIVTPEEFSDDE